MQVLFLAWSREKHINSKTGDTARKAAGFTEKILNIKSVLLHLELLATVALKITMQSGDHTDQR